MDSVDLKASMERIADVLLMYHARASNEARLHEHIETIFRRNNIPCAREVVIGGGERIDFTIGRIGLEVKIKGNTNEVLRQLGRYAESTHLDAVMLLATSARICAQVPPTLNEKPIRAVHLWRSALG